MVSASKRDSFIDFEDDSTDEGQELLAASDRSAEDCFFELLPNQQHSRRSKADYTVAVRLFDERYSHRRFDHVEHD